MMMMDDNYTSLNLLVSITITKCICLVINFVIYVFFVFSLVLICKPLIRLLWTCSVPMYDNDSIVS